MLYAHAFVCKFSISRHCLVGRSGPTKSDRRAFFVFFSSLLFRISVFSITRSIILLQSYCGNFVVLLAGPNRGKSACRMLDAKKARDFKWVPFSPEGGCIHLSFHLAFPQILMPRDKKRNSDKVQTTSFSLDESCIT